MADENLILSQQQALQQRLNPQQVIFGRLLQMSAHELEDEVRRQLEENPALREEDAPAPEENEENSADAYYEHGELRGRVRRSTVSPDFDPTSIVADDSEEDTSLNSAMNARLGELNLSPWERTLASYIIGNLDDNGYLPRTLTAIAADISSAEGREVYVEELRPVFAAIRTLEPAGIGAVDLRDCLLLQIDRLPESPAVLVAREILTHNFDLFSKKHTERLRARIETNDETFEEAMRLIRSLNPKPGSVLGQSRAQQQGIHLSPDFSVEPVGDSFIVRLLSRSPELTIERSFEPGNISAANGGQSSTLDRQRREAAAFIRRNFDEASSFIRLLRNRSQTLLAVMEAIVAHQAAFFASGDPATLRPMILKDIQATTGYDLSVISRACSDKYVSTPWGTFPLKYFFNERPQAHSDASQPQVIQALKEIIENEDPRHPLSDRALAEAMAAKGHDIARRTVTKYRERLGFPVGRLRRK